MSSSWRWTVRRQARSVHRDRCFSPEGGTLTTVRLFAAPAKAKPRDGLIAYSTKTGVQVIQPDGRGRRTLIPWRVASCGPRCQRWVIPRHPRWSPDGRRITYHLEYHRVVGGRGTVDGTRSQVMIADASGRNRRRLAEGHQPTFGPDGPTVVYLVNAGDPVIDEEKDGYKEDLGPMRAVNVATTITRDLPTRGSPEFSPDGSQMVLSTFYISALDGSGLRPVPTPAGPTYATAPRWNSDGFISYHCKSPGRFDADICLFDPATGKSRRLRRTRDLLDQEMDVAPSGRRYVVGALHGLYVVPPDGSGMRLLVRNNPAGVPVPSNVPTSPDWQPIPR